MCIRVLCGRRRENTEIIGGALVEVHFQECGWEVAPNIETSTTSPVCWNLVCLGQGRKSVHVIKRRSRKSLRQENREKVPEMIYIDDKLTGWGGSIGSREAPRLRIHTYSSPATIRPPSHLHMLRLCIGPRIECLQMHT